MSDHIQKTIDDAMQELRKREAGVVEIKKLINQLCAFASLPPRFQGDLGSSTFTGVAAAAPIRRNQYYGKPLATCVRDILENRKRLGGVHQEATLEDIMTALKEGSYDLDGISRDEDGQKRGVAISLAKNSTVFHKLPNGDWGLKAWYTNIRKQKPDKSSSGSAVDDDDTSNMSDGNAEESDSQNEALQDLQGGDESLFTKVGEEKSPSGGDAPEGQGIY